MSFDLAILREQCARAGIGNAGEVVAVDFDQLTQQYLIKFEGNKAMLWNDIHGIMARQKGLLMQNTRPAPGSSDRVEKKDLSFHEAIETARREREGTAEKKAQEFNVDKAREIARNAKQSKYGRRMRDVVADIETEASLGRRSEMYCYETKEERSYATDILLTKGFVVENMRHWWPKRSTCIFYDKRFRILVSW